MNKQEQIMQLVREWQKEDEEKRSVTLTMIEVVNGRLRYSMFRRDDWNRPPFKGH